MNESPCKNIINLVPQGLNTYNLTILFFRMSTSFLEIYLKFSNFLPGFLYVQWFVWPDGVGVLMKAVARLKSMAETFTYTRSAIFLNIFLLQH